MKPPPDRDVGEITEFGSASDSWVPSGVLHRRAVWIGAAGVAVLCVAAILHPGASELPDLHWCVAVSAFAAAAWVVTMALTKSHRVAVSNLGWRLLLPASWTWSACWILPVILFGAISAHGVEAAAAGLGMVAGAALGWSGAVLSLTAVARLAAGEHE